MKVAMKGSVDRSGAEVNGAGFDKLRNSWGLAGLLALLSVVAVLYVPYHVPQQPSSSASWLFAYNNHAGILLILCGAVAWAWWTRGRMVTLQPGAVSRLPQWVLWASLAVTLGYCMKLYPGAQIGGYSEASYNVHRVWLISLGERPYKDFEWPFGVAQLYVPYWLHRWLGFEIVRSVLLYWIAAAMAGAAFLYGAMNQMDFPSRYRKLSFLLVFVAMLQCLPNFGAQYTMLRYAATVYATIAVFGRARRAATRRDFVVLLGVVWSAVVLLLLLSPEMATGFAFTMTVLLFPRRREGWPKVPWLFYVLAIAGMAMLCLAASHLHEFDTAKASGGGSEGFPIILSLPLVWSFWQIGLCASVAYRQWTGATAVDNTLALVILTIPLSAAAFTRADPGHMLVNLMGLQMAALAYACASRGLRPWFLGCAIFMDLLMPRATILVNHVRRVGFHGRVAVVAQGSAARSKPVPETAVPETIDFATVYPNAGLRADTVLEAPFGYAPWVGNRFYLSRSVDYGYYKGIENGHNIGAIRRKVQELAEHPDRSLLVPVGATNCRYFSVESYQHILQEVDLTPYHRPGVHLEDPMGELCAYVLAHYEEVAEPSAENWNIGLWAPKRQ